MPWNERDLKTMREEFVKRVLCKEKNLAALCREYGISRPTGYKWLERHAQGLPLEDASRRPLRTPNRVDKAVEDMIVAKRKELPAIGAVKIRRILENDGKQNLPSTKTVNNIFKRKGLITKEASQAGHHNPTFREDVSQRNVAGRLQRPFRHGQRPAVPSPEHHR